MTDQPTDVAAPNELGLCICSSCGGVVLGRSALDLWKRVGMCPACTFGEAATLEEYDD